MGSFRDHVDVAGGLRSGLNDEPPWWARGAIVVFAGAVALVIAVSAVLGVGGGSPAGPAGDALQAAPGPHVTAPKAPEPVGPADAGEAPAPGDDRAAGVSATVALADRDGTFRQVPRPAVDAARGRGAGLLGLPADDVRHHLVSVEAGRVELAVSSLDGDREVRVVVTEVDGAWRAT